MTPHPFGLFAIALMLTGCVASEAAPAETPALAMGSPADLTHPADASGAADPVGPADDPWAGSDRIVLAAWNHTPGVAPPARYHEFDVLCMTGGGPQILREGGFVFAGTDHIEITLQVDALTTSGVQVGFVIDDPQVGDGNDPEGRIEWLPPVRGGRVTHVVSAAPEVWEDGVERWSFHARMNPGDDDLCYTGAAVEDYGVLIEAVRTPVDHADCDAACAGVA